MTNGTFIGVLLLIAAAMVAPDGRSLVTALCSAFGAGLLVYMMCVRRFGSARPAAGEGAQP